MLFDLFKKTAKLQQSDVPTQSEFGDSFGKCGRNARWKYDTTDHSFVISGEGSIEQFENINDYLRRTMHDPHCLGPWYEDPAFSSSSIPGTVTEITIPEGITSIASMAFWWFKSLKSVRLPKSIEKISESAFLHVEEIVFLVQKDSFAEKYVDSMGWSKSYYSIAATDNEKTCTKERYTYYVGDVSSTDPWIFVACNEVDTTWDSEPFTDLVKKAAGIMNDGIWEGNILPAGIFPGDTRYRIKNDPLLMVYQYDTLFGIVIEYMPGIGLDGALSYLSNVLCVAVDEKFRKPFVEKKPTHPEKKPKAKWQAVYDAAASLHIFKEVNERYLQCDGYQKLIEILSEKYHSLDIVEHTDPHWKESSQELSITGAYEHWVGHDETLSESIEMKLRRLHPWEWDEPSEWSTESEWPCEGEFQYLNESKNEGDNWNYSTMTHKAWMLKAPLGLPGVWSFEYISKRDRQ